MDFPGGSVVKNLPVNAGDTGLIPGLGKSPGGGNGNPLKYSCLENLRDGGAWRAAVYGVAQSQTQLKWLSSSSSSTSMKQEGDLTMLSLWVQHCFNYFCAFMTLKCWGLGTRGQTGKHILVSQLQKGVLYSQIDVPEREAAGVRSQRTDDFQHLLGSQLLQRCM